MTTAVTPLTEQRPTVEQMARIAELSQVMYGDARAWLKEFGHPATRGGASEIIKVLVERPDYHILSEEPGLSTVTPEAHAWAKKHMPGSSLAPREPKADKASAENKAKVEASVQSRRQEPASPSPPPPAPKWEYETARWRYFDALMGLVEKELETYSLSHGHLTELLDRVERLVAVIDGEA